MGQLCDLFKLLLRLVARMGLARAWSNCFWGNGAGYIVLQLRFVQAMKVKVN